MAGSSQSFPLEPLHPKPLKATKHPTSQNASSLPPRLRVIVQSKPQSRSVQGLSLCKSRVAYHPDLDVEKAIDPLGQNYDFTV